MPFNFETFEIAGPVLVQPKIFSDERGYFLEAYKCSEFSQAGISEQFQQDNYSLSRENVLRGLHFQLGAKAQGKLVRAVVGRIWDVAVDMRKSSPTFGKWVGVELNDENNYALYVPVGFAHGFVALADNTRVVYKTTNEYAPELERGVRWNDPGLAIDWPVASPIIAPRDAAFPLFKDAEYFT